MVLNRRAALAGLLGAAVTTQFAVAWQDPIALEEAKRIAVVKKVSPSVVAVVTGGGSGVVISPDGYALTNFHVVQGQGGALRCGLPDGILYDAVLVGLDKIGDVALVKLLPRKDKDGKDIPFPYAEIGDSDTVKVGDWSFAMGNPFLLAADFTPTVTFGLVSGTHRYQYPERGMFEYTDCIQVDTSINPGNSGGPLFDMNGKLVGINGRGSFDKRGRVNSGVGYAITLNQILNFMGSLRSGMLVDHASLGATVATANDEELERPQVLVSNLISSDAERRGLALGDEIIRLAGRRVSTVNQFKNVLGIFPKGWRVPVTYRRRIEGAGTQTRQILVRLMGYEKRELDESGRPVGPGGRPAPKPGRPGQPMPPMPGENPAEKEEGPPSPALKLYEEKAGYANWLINKQRRDSALAGLKAAMGDLGAAGGVWTAKGKGFLGEKKVEAPVSLAWSELAAGKPEVVSARVDGVDFSLEPLKPDLTAQALRDPAGSGGMLAALHLLRLFLAKGEKAFPQGMTHAGEAPLYPPLDQDPEDWWPLRKNAQVLEGTLGGTKALAFVTEEKGADGKPVTRLSCLEVWLAADEDPCELHLDRVKAVAGGRSMPHLITVRHNNINFLRLEVESWELR
jgi:S1-C subfamily serine protease